MPKVKALIVVNPQSGKMKSRKGLYDIVSTLNKNGYEATVFFTTAPKDAIEITATKAPMFDAVICCGGDGTLNEVISGLMQANATLPIGYIPTGTTNDFAKTLNLPKNILKATEAIIKGIPAYHDIGVLQENVFFAYIASFGAFSTVSYTTPQWLKNKLGHLAYTLQGIKGVGGIRPYKVKVITNDSEIEDTFIFGCVANTTSIGGILTLPSDKVSLNDGLFEVLLIRQPQKRGDLRNALYGLNSKKYDDCGIFFTHTNHITFEFDTDVAWSSDGEFGGKYTKVDIRVVQDKVQIIRFSDKTTSAICEN